MANMLHFLDIWIVETNTVYKEVPFTVVTDWLQQGRLLEDDQVRPSGSKDWVRLGEFPVLIPYTLKPELHRAEDVAEALEPVDVGFHVRRPMEDPDEEVDMIPLIDVSLVLLVFFMLVGSTVAMASFVDTPETEHGLMADNPEALRIDIAVNEGTPVYSLGVGDKPAEAEEANLVSILAVLNRLQIRLSHSVGPVELVINADKKLPAKIPRDLLIALRREPFRSRISVNYFGVSEASE